MFRSKYLLILILQTITFALDSDLFLSKISTFSNFVSSAQVCWEKFARYFEVELKEVKLSEAYYVMDPAKAVEMVDENSICVAAILGSTFTGEFEYVKLLNDLLAEKNAKTAWETPIHVDAASGGFIASMGEEYQCQ